MKIIYNRFIALSLLSVVVLFSTSPASAQSDVNEGLTDVSLENDENYEDIETEIFIQHTGRDVRIDSNNVIQPPLEKPLKPSTENTQVAPAVSQTSDVSDEAIAELEENMPEFVDSPYSGTYYDASSIGDNSLTNITAPRQVDPRYEPGSSFVVVQKSAAAGSTPARIVAAQRALNLGRYGAALEFYEGLYSELPKNEQVLMGLAVAQQKSGFTESAIATYEELLKINPNNTDGMVNMLGLLKSQYPAVAFRRLRELWQENPSNAYIAGELGLLTASMGQAKQALTYLGAASSLEPNNASHYYNMAVINDRAGQVASAIELYQKALQVDIAFGAGQTLERDQIYDRLARLRRL